MAGAGGFEPPNAGTKNRCLRPLGYAPLPWSPVAGMARNVFRFARIGNLLAGIGLCQQRCRSNPPIGVIPAEGLSSRVRQRLIGKQSKAGRPAARQS